MGKVNQVRRIIEEMKRIDELCANAWWSAVDNVAKAVNRRLNTNYSAKADWDMLENIAMDFGIRFDDNGEIVK